MAKARSSRLPQILDDGAGDLLPKWTKELKARSGGDKRISDSELAAQAKEFFELLRSAAKSEELDIDGKEWRPLLEFLEGISRSRVTQGFSSDETATFLFTLKRPLFEKIREELKSDASALAEETWNATELIDSLGLYTVKAYQKSREDVINRQQMELLELSTPVVKLWEGVLALPMIGTLDSGAISKSCGWPRQLQAAFRSPSTNTMPSIRSCNLSLPFNFLQRDSALRASLNAIASPASREPGPLVR